MPCQTPVLKDGCEAMGKIYKEEVSHGRFR